MADKRIDSVFDEPRIRAEFDKLYALLDKYRQSILAVHDTAKNINPSAGLSESIKVVKQATQAHDELARTKQKLAFAESEYGRHLAEAKLALQQQNKANKEAAALTLGLADAYKTLSDQYNSSARLAKNLAVIYGVNSTAAKEAAARANDLGKQLKAIDASVGQYQRNVGNYASATFALSQILREAPAFALNLQTGLLALSNNLPILFDEFTKLSKAIDESTGKQIGAMGALGQLTRSLFSWTNILTIGVTLVTVFGKQIGEWATELFKGKEVIDRVKKSQELLNSSLSEGSGEYQTAVKLVNELKINIDLAKAGFISKEKVIKQYNESIGETTGEVKTLDEAERELVKNGDAYIQMMLLKAAANLALEEAAKKAFEAEQARRKEAEEFATSLDKTFAGAAVGAAGEQGGGLDLADAEKIRKEKGAARQKQFVKEKEDAKKTFEDIARQFQQDAAAISKKYKFDFFGKEFDEKGDPNKLAQDQLKAVLESQKTALETAAINQKAIFEDETRSYDERIAATNMFALTQDAIAKKQREIDIADAGKVTNKKLEAEETYKKASTQNAIEHANTLKEIAKSSADEETKAIIAKSEAQQRAIQEAEDKELSALQEKYTQGILTREQYEAAKLQIQNKYANESLQSDISFIQQSIQQAKDKGQSVSEEEKKLADLQNKIRDENLKYEEDRLKTEYENKKKYDDLKLGLEKKYNDRLKELRKEAFDFAVEIGNSLFEYEKNNIQGQIDAVEEKKNADIKAVEQSVATEQEKADQIAIINASAQAQREALEKRQRDVDAKAAIFQKFMAILQIGIATAEAIAKINMQAAILSSNPFTAALAAMAYAQIPIVIATGALQAAAVAAKPIPRYWMGRERGPAEVAYTGDGGVHEVISAPDGRAWVTPDRATLTYLPENYKVHPSIDDYLETAKWTAFRPLPNVEDTAVGDRQLAEMIVKGVGQDLGKVAKAIALKPDTRTIITREGLKQQWHDGNEWNDYLNLYMK